jgi:hypothetical protein
MAYHVWDLNQNKSQKENVLGPHHIQQVKIPSIKRVGAQKNKPNKLLKNAVKKSTFCPECSADDKLTLTEVGLEQVKLQLGRGLRKKGKREKDKVRDAKEK